MSNRTDGKTDTGYCCYTREEFSKARCIVEEEIRSVTADLEAVAKGEDQEPVMVDGETETGYYCRLMVDPKDAAKIMLNYDYPIYKVTGMEPPQGMWDELARKFGLSSVMSVDL